MGTLFWIYAVRMIGFPCNNQLFYIVCAIILTLCDIGLIIALLALLGLGFSLFGISSYVIIEFLF